MLYVNHLFFMQGHCIFACIKLLDVILLLHLLAKEGNQHGMWMKKTHKFLCASALLQTQYHSIGNGSIRTDCCFYV